jgi:hypothetical protein
MCVDSDYDRWNQESIHSTSDRMRSPAGQGPGDKERRGPWTGGVEFVGLGFEVPA